MEPRPRKSDSSKGIGWLVLAIISGGCALLLFGDSEKHPTNIVYGIAALILAAWLAWTGAKKMGGGR